MVAALAPEAAWAHKSTKKHTHRARTTTQYSSGSSSAVASSSSYERRLRELEDEVAALRAAKAQAPAKVQEIESRQAAVEQQVAENKAELEKKSNDDLVFFRGGFTQMSQARTNELLINNTTLNNLGINDFMKNPERNGWYVGAGLDFRLSDDFWGVTDLVAVDAEIMFQYMNFGTNTNALVSAATGTIAGANLGAQGGMAGAPLPAGTVKIENSISQFTLVGSPKFKFNLLEGALRPWIIPFGLSINVISPPSSGITVLNPGLMLGTGLEYNVWKNIWVGADFRYNFTGNELNYKATVPGIGTVYNKTNTDGLTTGAYIGLGF
jgi:opacity protein-like surface antigen